MEEDMSRVAWNAYLSIKSELRQRHKNALLDVIRLDNGMVKTYELVEMFEDILGDTQILSLLLELSATGQIVQAENGRWYTSDHPEIEHF
jgi:glycerol kinase